MLVYFWPILHWQGFYSIIPSAYFFFQFLFASYIVVVMQAGLGGSFDNFFFCSF